MSKNPVPIPRVVIDSSVLLPILRYPQPETNWLVSMWVEGRLIPLANVETLYELEAKLLEHSPTVREYPAKRFVESAMRRYEPWCEIVPLTDSTKYPVCEDPTDQKFVDLAFSGNADFLIARDGALLSMGSRVPFVVRNDHTYRELHLT